MKSMVALFCGVAFILLFEAAASATPRISVVEGERFVIDLRYATKENFLKKDVYKEFGLDRCHVLRRVKQGLLKIVPELKRRKLRLVLLDCWRPLAVQKKMWELFPNPGYVADPAKGSNHNRGVAIDVTLVRESGKRVAMPTEFDDFTPRAHRDFQCDKAERFRCSNRKLLESLMQTAGLKGLPTEWWHFQLPEAFNEPNPFPIIGKI